MKLLELSIHEIRGIRDLSIKLDGANFLIWGPNGTGKSGIIDAIDFLLTGSMGRLQGEGTASISLKKHGPHVNANPKNAWVSGVIALHNGTQFKMTRSIQKPDEPQFEGPPEGIEELFELLSRRHHVLTRKDILQYIASAPNDRAKGVQMILNLAEIEEIRKALVKANNLAKSTFQPMQKVLASTEADINMACRTTTFTETAIIDVVNQSRKQLGGISILSLAPSEIKKGLTAPITPEGPRLNSNAVSSDIETLTKIIDEAPLYETKRLELLKLLEELKIDPASSHSSKLLTLSKLGLDLIDGSENTCPLCELPFTGTELRAILDSRINKIEQILSKQGNVREKATSLLKTATTAVSLGQRLAAAAEKVSHSQLSDSLKNWNSSLDAFIPLLTSLASGTTNMSSLDFEIRFPEKLKDNLALLQVAAQASLPAISPQLQAWDILTRLEENLRQYERQNRDLKNAEKLALQTNSLAETYNFVKDIYLTRLYESIKDRFVQLYKTLHGEDEANFEASLESDEAGLEFLVEFYGKGKFPPNALHSEGHQDSMGLCLYLALAEFIYGDRMELIVLDDVVMSVDTGHRRQLCRMLRQEFHTKQFIITTHDKVWERQLIQQSVVTPSHSIRFSSWNVETGPRMRYEEDDWKLLEAAISSNDIPHAAWMLRNMTEEFFQDICESLRVPVVFSTSGKYELGDLMIPAMNEHKQILKRALALAQASKDKVLFEKLNAIEELRKSLRTDLFTDDWIVNASIHYNSWADFHPNEFKPVMEAFRTLFSMLRCDICGTWLQKIEKERKVIAVSCNCNAIQFAQ